MISIIARQKLNQKPLHDSLTVSPAGKTQKAVLLISRKTAQGDRLSKSYDCQSVPAFIVPVPGIAVISSLVQLDARRLDLPGRPIPSSSSDWMTGVFMLALILFASVKLFFSNYLKQLFHSAVNWSTASRLFRERSLSVVHAVVRLDLIFYLIFSLFIYQMTEYYRIDLPFRGTLVHYGLILGVLFLFYFFKNLFYYLQGSLSEEILETLEYLYNLKNYNRILGLMLIPVSLLIAFAPVPDKNPFFIGGLLLVSVFYILRLFRGAKILLRKHFSIFYLILYLCTLEFLPLIFICKLVLV